MVLHHAEGVGMVVGVGGWVVGGGVVVEVSYLSYKDTLTFV